MPTKLIHRSNTLLPANATTATRPDFGIGYSVNALEVGGQVAIGSSGNSITLRKGHGLRVGSKFFKFSAGETPALREVLTADATENVITMTGGEVLSVVVGDKLVNCGVDDTGSSVPSYDGGNLPIYSDMDGSTVLSGSLVVSDATGGYEYWYRGREVWELIRDTAGLPQAVEIFVGGQGAVVDVMDFGAVGDGVADDYRAIQNAIDSLLNNDTLYFPDGYTFLIGTGLVFDPDTAISHTNFAANQVNITFKGGGVIKSTTAIVNLTVRNADHFVFEGLRLEGNNVASSSGMVFESCLSTKIQHCIIGNKYLGFQTGIKISGTDAALTGGGNGAAQHEVDVIESHIMVKNVASSVGIQQECADCIHRGNYIRGPVKGIAVTSAGADVVATENLIQDCHIYGYPSSIAGGYPMLSGIEFKKFGSGEPQGLMIRGCHFGSDNIGHVPIDCEDASALSVDSCIFTIGSAQASSDVCIKFINTSAVGLTAISITNNQFDYSRLTTAADTKPIHVSGLNAGEDDVWFNSPGCVFSGNQFDGVTHSNPTGVGWVSVGGMRSEDFRGGACEMRPYSEEIDLTGLSAGGNNGSALSIVGGSSQSIVIGVSYLVTEAFAGGSITDWDMGINDGGGTSIDVFYDAEASITLNASGKKAFAYINTFSDGKLYITVNGSGGPLTAGKIRVSVHRFNISAPVS